MLHTIYFIGGTSTREIESHNSPHINIYPS